MRRKIIFCDIIFLICSVVFLIYISFIPFFDYKNILVFVIIPIYEILNIIKSIVMFTFYLITHLTQKQEKV